VKRVNKHVNMGVRSHSLVTLRLCTDTLIYGLVERKGNVCIQGKRLLEVYYFRRSLHPIFFSNDTVKLRAMLKYLDSWLVDFFGWKDVQRIAYNNIFYLVLRLNNVHQYLNTLTAALVELHDRPVRNICIQFSYTW